MITLEDFLKTGRLGPVVLGLTPFDVESILGEPDHESKKKNPLMLLYRSLQLSFWRLGPETPSSLNQIVIKFQPEPFSLPEAVQPTDWNPASTPTVDEFKTFLQKIRYTPSRWTPGFFNSQQRLPSGVIATFTNSKLDRLQIDKRQDVESSEEIEIDEREPKLADIQQMFDEAETLLRTQSPRAALVLAWAGLEAVLRRRAAMARLQGRIGVQPMVFIRELQATGNITPEEFAFIDQIRRERTSIAHGLAPTFLAEDNVLRVIYLGKRFLAELRLHPSEQR
jgi:hypothetical protein